MLVVIAAFERSANGTGTEGVRPVRAGGFDSDHRAGSVPALLLPGTGTESGATGAIQHEVLVQELRDYWDRAEHSEEMQVREVPADTGQPAEPVIDPVREGFGEEAANGERLKATGVQGCLGSLPQYHASAWSWCENELAAGRAYQTEDGSIIVGAKPEGVLDVGVDSGPADPSADIVGSVVPSVESIAGTAEEAFYEGYALGGGPNSYAAHAYRIITTCEGRENRWHGWYGLHITRAQFSADTWKTVSAFVARQGFAPDPDSPFVVGMAVSYWIRVIGVEAAGTTSGWPHCWWQ